MSTPGQQETPYRLRETSRTPGRFRNYLEDEVQQYDQVPEYSGRPRRQQQPQRMPKQSPTKRVLHQPPSEYHQFNQPPAADHHDYDYDAPDHNVYQYGTDRFGCPKGTELSDALKDNLRKLKNVLKLPKARRFVFCEFFYSGVDKQIFLGENEFSQLIRESFPNLKTFKLRKPEWREVRRLIGKPRRCSQVFLNEERQALAAKRAKIRTIYDGTCTSLGSESIDLPALLPRPLVVGQKIYSRVRSPKDGIYSGTIDALLEEGYRVVFEKEELIPPLVIKDYEVMSDQPSELLSISYFLEMNRANARGVSKPAGPQQMFPSTSYQMDTRGIRYSGAGPSESITPTPATHAMAPRKVTPARDEKVGNFPVRMLVILVKLCKLIEYKKQLIANLTLMNDAAEKMNMFGNKYDVEFKTKFAEQVIDIENVNRLFKTYFDAIQEYHGSLIPHLSEPAICDRPEHLRKSCRTHAVQIVKHCNADLNVSNKRALSLITSLASLLLQVKSIGFQQKKRCTGYDFSLLTDSLKELREQVLPANASAFQDSVEVHMKQIHSLLVNGTGTP